jgi:PTH1 family peptidyl-tRNA hydrolase
MKLILGLGNPGPRYVHNRHNVGFQCLNYLARAHGLSFSSKRGLARIATGELAGQPVVLAKPQTYMNLSGRSAASLVRGYRLVLADLLVIYDDADLPLGRLRLRPGGSAGGHLGMGSIIEALGSQDIPRLRVGIGRPQEPVTEGELRAYVLSDFTLEQQEIMKGVYPRVAEAILCLLAEGLEAAMNRFN